MAPGSHEWNGYCADFVNAPTSTSTRPTVTAVPRRRVGQHLAELERAAAGHRLPDQHEARQHRQTAGPRDQQRLQGGGPGLDRRVVVADEQERRDRRQLPEAEQHDQVVGQDQPEHRAGEQHQQAEQPPLAGAAAGPGSCPSRATTSTPMPDTRAANSTANPSSRRSRSTPSCGTHATDSVTGRPSSGARSPSDQPGRRGRRRHRRQRDRPPRGPAAPGDQAEADHEVREQEGDHRRHPSRRVGTRPPSAVRDATASTSGGRGRPRRDERTAERCGSGSGDDSSVPSRRCDGWTVTGPAHGAGRVRSGHTGEGGPRRRTCAVVRDGTATGTSATAPTTRVAATAAAAARTTPAPDRPRPSSGAEVVGRGPDHGRPRRRAGRPASCCSTRPGSFRGRTGVGRRLPSDAGETGKDDQDGEQRRDEAQATGGHVRPRVVARPRRPVAVRCRAPPARCRRTRRGQPSRTWADSSASTSATAATWSSGRRRRGRRASMPYSRSATQRGSS